MHTVLKSLNKRLYPQKLFYSPDHVILVVNNVCNLHCKMCDVGAEFTESNFYVNMMGAHPLNMPLELVKIIVDQMADSAPQAKLGFAFTEPIIYPYLIEAVAYADSKQIATQITTNGSKLAQLAADLQRAGMKEICVSIDGPPEVHNHIRGNKHSFEWAYNGLETVASLSGDRPEISVACAITEWNFDQLGAFAELFRKLPLERLMFLHTNYTMDHTATLHNSIYGTHYPATPSNMKELHLDKMNLEILQREILKIKSAQFPFNVTFSPELIESEELDLFYFQPEKKIGKRCGSAFDSITVKSDGSVIPAHTRCYQVNAGNMYDTPLKEIWNSEMISKFRNTLSQAGGLLPACTRCCSAF